MNNSQKVLLVGPVAPPVHGQSLAFSIIKDSLDKNGDCFFVNTNFTNSNNFIKLWSTLLYFFQISFIFVFKKNEFNKVYFTCSRSFMGSIKDLILLVFCSVFDKKCVNHVHGANFKSFIDSLPLFFRVIYIFLYEKVVIKTLVLIDKMGFELGQVFKEHNFFTVNNPCEENFALEVRDKSSISPSNKNFIFFSNLMKSKGVVEVIEAFKVLKSEYSNVTLTICGKPFGDREVSKVSIKKIISDLTYGVHGVEVLFDGVYGRDKVNLFAKADVFVLPSYYESEAIPISIIEALASFNLIILSDHNYLKDFSDKYSFGFVCEKGSVSSLYSTMREVCDLDGIKSIDLKRRNREIYEANFTQRNYVDKVLDSLR